MREEKALPDGYHGMGEGCRLGKRSKWHQGGTVRVPEQQELDKQSAVSFRMRLKNRQAGGFSVWETSAIPDKWAAIEQFK